MFKYVMFGIATIALVLAAVAIVSNGSEEVTVAYTSESILEESSSGEAAILDVRTPAEYAAGHIETSQNHNVELIRSGNFPELAVDQKIYVYCRSGNRSAQADQLLTNAGYTNIVDIGGLADWESLGGILVN